MSALRWISALCLVLAVLIGTAWLLQRQTSAALRTELELLRDENREIARLRAEHQKLIAAQPGAAEVERLRADRAALIRLRAEIDELKSGVERMARAEKLPRGGAESPPTARPVKNRQQ